MTALTWVDRARIAPYRADYRRMERMSRAERARYAASAANRDAALRWCDDLRCCEDRADRLQRRKARR